MWSRWLGLLCSVLTRCKIVFTRVAVHFIFKNFPGIGLPEVFVMFISEIVISNRWLYSLCKCFVCWAPEILATWRHAHSCKQTIAKPTTNLFLWALCTYMILFCLLCTYLQHVFLHRLSESHWPRPDTLVANVLGGIRMLPFTSSNRHSTARVCCRSISRKDTVLHCTKTLLSAGAIRYGV